MTAGLHANAAGARTRSAGLSAPIHVPSLTANERGAFLTDLRLWVDGLVTRFELDHRTIPACWEQHPGMVEILAAILDHERSAYAPSASADEAVSWLRAVRDMTVMLRDLTAVTGCTATEHRTSLARRRPASAFASGAPCEESTA